LSGLNNHPPLTFSLLIPIFHRNQIDLQPLIGGKAMFRLKILAAITVVVIATSVSSLAQTQTQNQQHAQDQPQTQPEAMELLKKVAETYRNLKSYHFEGVEIRETRGEGTYSRTESPFVWASEKPGKFKMETKAPLYMRMIWVSDGQTAWNYNARLNQYTKKSALPAQKAGDAEPGAPQITHNSGIPSITDRIGGARIADLARSAKTLREEAISAGGHSINCYVVEAEGKAQNIRGVSHPPPVTTYWIDKVRLIVLRKTRIGTYVSFPYQGRMEMNEWITLSHVKVDEPLAASLFAFTQPEEAKEVADFDYNIAYEPPNLTGNPAPNFDLKDLDGKSFSLESARGKAVLLNFWSSW
jgi:outer membrane lipoprotein-sorting protein